MHGRHGADRGGPPGVLGLSRAQRYLLIRRVGALLESAHPRHHVRRDADGALDYGDPSAPWPLDKRRRRTQWSVPMSTSSQWLVKDELVMFHYSHHVRPTTAFYRWRDGRWRMATVRDPDVVTRLDELALLADLAS